MIDKLLVQQALANLRRAPGASPADGAGKNPIAADPSAQRAPRRASRPADFEQQVRQRVGQISPDDPQRRRRALRLVIEASLLREFGDLLGSDPAFHAIVDDVTRTVESDPALAGTIDTALQALLSPPASGD